MPSAITFSQIIQEANGLFKVEAIASGNLNYCNWREDRTIICPSATGFISVSKVTVNFARFVVRVSAIKISFDVSVKLNPYNNRLQFNITNTSMKDVNFSFELPSGTIVTSADYTYILDTIRAMIKGKLSIDTVTKKLDASFEEIFLVINFQSGKVSDNIKYYFHFTPKGLTFPSDNGIQCRFEGTAKVRNTSSPDEAIELPFPDVPTNHDAVFHVSNCAFRSLFWAYQLLGMFDFTMDGFRAESQHKLMFTTEFFCPSKFYADYPNRNLVVQVDVIEKPTVLCQVKTVSYTCLVTIWLAQLGSGIARDKQICKIHVTETAHMRGFALSSNIHTFAQSLTFDLFLQSQNRSFIHKVVSKYEGIDSETLSKLWKLVLSPIVMYRLNVASRAGVPIPSLLKGVYKDWEISFTDQFVTVAVNFGSKNKFMFFLPSHAGPMLDSHKYINFSY